MNIYETYVVSKMGIVVSDMMSVSVRLSRIEALCIEGSHTLKKMMVDSQASEEGQCEVRGLGLIALFPLLIRPVTVLGLGLCPSFRTGFAAGWVDVFLIGGRKPTLAWTLIGGCLFESGWLIKRLHCR